VRRRAGNGVMASAFGGDRDRTWQAICFELEIA
jgi:hypothetical protein